MAYSVLGLKPTEFWEMDFEDFANMYKAVRRREEEEFDISMQVMSIQTALLMNASGNMKQEVKPSDIYESKYNSENNKTPVKNIDEQRKELLESFGIEYQSEQQE